MPQLHLYVSDDVADEVKRRAKCAGVSVSKYLAEYVEKEHAPLKEWPDWFWKDAVGFWQGEPLERPEQLPYEEREPLE